jgi:hypothetical protein
VNELDEHVIQCPYCWEHQTLLLDLSFDRQEYVEDCQVCCQPILLRVWTTSGGPRVEALRENA